MPLITLRLVALALALSSPAAGPQRPNRPGPVGTLPSLGPAMELAEQPVASGQLAGVGTTPAFEQIVTPILEPSPEQVRFWARRQTYQNSIYRVDPESDAADLPPLMLEVVSEMLTGTDFIPFDRLNYFAWCFEPDKAVVGWSGHIEEVCVTPLGWFVVVRVSPRLEWIHSVGALTNDCVLEGYYFDSMGLVEYLGSMAGPHAKPRSIFGF